MFSTENSTDMQIYLFQKFERINTNWIAGVRGEEGPG